MPHINATISDALNAKEIVSPYLEECRNSHDYSRFMGSTHDSVIILKYQKKGHGDNIVFPMFRTGEPFVAVNEEPLEGANAKENSSLIVDADTLQIGTVRYATEVKNVPLTELITNLDLMKEVKENLARQTETLTNKRVTHAFVRALLSENNDIQTAVINKQFTDTTLLEKMELLTIEKKKSYSRILIGNPRIDLAKKSHTTLALARKDILDDEGRGQSHGMSVAHIRQLYAQASSGKALQGDKETPIQFYKTGKAVYDNFPTNCYALFIPPEAYNQLTLDQEWRAQVSRGWIEKPSQPSTLNGSQFKGMIEGVSVFTNRNLSPFILKKGEHASSVAYSVLCGAAALVFGQGTVPYFTANSINNFGRVQAIEHNEISAIKALMYKSLKPDNDDYKVENSIIHSFTSLE